MKEEEEKRRCRCRENGTSYLERRGGLLWRAVAGALGGGEGFDFNEEKKKGRKEAARAHGDGAPGRGREK